MIKKIEKNIYLPSGVRAQIDLGIPLGEDYIEEAVNSDFVDNILINQVTRGLKDATTKYVQSPLPNTFLEGQRVIVTTDLPYDVFSAFDRRNDTIYIDPDRLSIPMRGTTPEFIFGYEMGQKIQKYRDNASAYQAIAEFFGINPCDTELISAVYADIVGNIAANGYATEEDAAILSLAGVTFEDESVYHLDTTITPQESSYIKKRVLHSIYHV